jgi:hypothetical protein
MEPIITGVILRVVIACCATNWIRVREVGSAAFVVTTVRWGFFKEGFAPPPRLAACQAIAASIAIQRNKILPTVSAYARILNPAVKSESTWYKGARVWEQNGGITPCGNGVDSCGVVLLDTC